MEAWAIIGKIFAVLFGGWACITLLKFFVEDVCAKSVREHLKFKYIDADIKDLRERWKDMVERVARLEAYAKSLDNKKVDK